MGKSKYVILATMIAAIEEAARRAIRTKANKVRQEKVSKSWKEDMIPDIHPGMATFDHVSGKSYTDSLIKVDLTEKEQEAWKALAFDALGQMGYDMALVKSFDGLLKCDIPISQLFAVKGGYGQVRGFALTDGKFSQQGIFENVSLKQATPLLVFQALSVVTSQYYQNIISNQLEGITGKVDLLAEYLQAEDKSWLSLAFSKLKEYGEQRSFSELDRKSLEEISDRMNLIRKKCRDLLSGIDVTISYSWTDLSEVESKIRKLNDSHFFTFLDMARCAEVLYYSANVLLVRASVLMGQPDDIVSKYRGRLSLDFWKEYAQKFSQIRHGVLNYIERSQKSAWFNKERIAELLTDMEDKFNKEFDAFQRTTGSLDRPVTLFLALNEDGKVIRYREIGPDEAEAV